MRPIRTSIDASCLALLLASSVIAASDATAITDFEALIKAGKYVEVGPSLEAYTTNHPDSWKAFYQLGYVDFRLHRIQESVNMLCKSLVLNKQFAESHKILAYDLNILGRQDLAIHELGEALRYDPASAESYYELGRIYYEKGSYVNAIRNLEKAKLLNPEFVRVYHNLGLAYSAVSENDKAVEDFELGLRLNARAVKPSAWPLIDYATYFNMQNKFEKARDLLLKAVQIDHSWDQEFDELSKAYRGLGQTSEAIAALKRAILLNPHKAEYHYVLARLYSQTNQSVQAKQELAQYEREKSPRSK